MQDRPLGDALLGLWYWKNEYITRTPTGFNYTGLYPVNGNNVYSKYNGYYLAYTHLSHDYKI